MYLSEIKVKNFRLLKDISIQLESDTTLIVGRNNSGKTSLTHLLGYIFSGNTPKKLELYDFSIDCINIFKDIGSIEEFDLNLLPQIIIELYIDYSSNKNEYPPFLQPFIVDLDSTKSKAKAKISYSIHLGKEIDFIEDIKEIKNQLEGLEQQNNLLFNDLSQIIKKHFSWSAIAVSPIDETNTRALGFNQLFDLIRGYFISAQRALGDYQSSEKDTIGNVIKSIVTKTTESDQATGELVEKLNKIQTDLTILSQNTLNEMIPSIDTFGSDYNDNITTDVHLDIESFTPHLNMSYVQPNTGLKLPEHYNGLGRRNLLLISIKLVDYLKSYLTDDKEIGINLIFIEEPEAYFHPQMQETFIATLLSYKNKLEKKYLGDKKWPVQFIITTHSSHIANKEGFQKIRYFKATDKIIDDKFIRTTEVKDLRTFSETKQNKDFLHQYLKLTTCDLFFADKAILIEGTTERLLFPAFIKQYGANKPNNLLLSQYITIIEVGGAYAQKFYNLVDFLKLPTLIITDIDTVDYKQKGKDKTCCVTKGKTTSNSCILNWFNSSDELKNSNYLPSLIIQQKESEKIKGHKRICYQTPEENHMVCGRSLEAAMMLANLDLFGLSKIDPNKLEEIVWMMTKKMSSKKKTKWAFDFAFKKNNWNNPKYIEEGLLWLEQQGINND